MRHRSLLLLLLPTAVMLGGAVPFPEDSPIAQQVELLPASPAVNDQRGFAIAMDGEWLAVGARLEHVNGIQHAGAVYLFRFDAPTGTWRDRVKLTSQEPSLYGQFGFAVDINEGMLAIGAIGDRKVYVWGLEAGEWSFVEHRDAPEEARQFGRSVSIDGDWLAVGAEDPLGETPGAVYFYSGNGSGKLTSLSRGDRFGQAVSLRGGLLAVGVPGANGAKGAVHLLELVGETFVPSGPNGILADPSLEEGDQFGFSVAIHGNDVVVGAPTAGNDNSGAVWIYSKGGNLTRLPGGGGPGGQLGYSVAIDGDRIAAGAPEENLTGSVHLFTRTAGIWSAAATPDVESSNSFDLSGVSVAVSGEWVMSGAALADSGGDAAGAIASLRCRPVCESSGEVVVGGEAARERFGTSVAADGDLFAVGAYDENLARVSVAVFRRAAKGWRQEARLLLPSDRPEDFNAPIAFHNDTEEGDLLVVGSPTYAGAVLLYRRVGESWLPESTLVAPIPFHGSRFGRSVSTDGRTVVVGAGTDHKGSSRGAAYAFEYQGKGEWSAGIPLLLPKPEDIEDPEPPLEGDAFGFAVSVQGGTIVVGAPFAKGRDGEAHVFLRRKEGWVWESPLGGANLDEFGSSVAIDGDTIVVGAPRHADGGPYAGAVYVFKGPGWLFDQVLSGDEPIDPKGQKQGFGSAVALRDEHLLVGAPVIGFLTLDIDKAFLFERNEADVWRLAAGVDAIRRIPQPGGDFSPSGDHFGTGVALGNGFFVVSNPGSSGGDRVSVFELRAKPEEQP